MKTKFGHEMYGGFFFLTCFDRDSSELPIALSFGHKKTICIQINIGYYQPLLLKYIAKGTIVAKCTTSLIKTNLIMLLAIFPANKQKKFPSPRIRLHCELLEVFITILSGRSSKKFTVTQNFKSFHKPC